MSETHKTTPAETHKLRHLFARAQRIIACVDACAGLSFEEITRIPLLLKALDNESDINGSGGPNDAMRFLAIVKDTDSASMEARDQDLTSQALANAKQLAGFIIAHAELVTIKSTKWGDNAIQCPPDVWKAANAIVQSIGWPEHAKRRLRS